MKTGRIILHYFNKIIVLVFHPNLTRVYMKRHLTSQSLVWRSVRTAGTISWFSAGFTHIQSRGIFSAFFLRKINIGSITRTSSVFLTQRERERERERDRERETERERETDMKKIKIANGYLACWNIHVLFLNCMFLNVIRPICNI